MTQFAKIAFTESVKKVQSVMGTRQAMQRLADHPQERDSLTDEQMEFIHNMTSAYIASASSDGMPYIQHRGGEAGFIRVVNANTLMMSDLPGNGQYITQGNLSENPRAMMFFMDYTNRRRLKVWGEAFVSYDANLKTMMNGPGDTEPYPVIVFRVKAWDENCPKHIPQMFDKRVIDALESRIHDLELGMMSMSEAG